MADGKRVWTTLITNLDYLEGLFTLDYSLRKNNSKYPLVALYTDTFPESGRAALERRGIPAQRIEYLLPTKSTRDYSADPRFYDCWSKLTPFSLTAYDRVVQLDSDMLVLQNMDELMELELDAPAIAAAGGPDSKRVFAASYACTCNPLKKPQYPRDWVPSNCAFTAQHGTPEKAQSEGADPSSVPLPIINGGLQVVNPSKEVFQQIVDYMEDNAADLDFADQSLLSNLFTGRWVALPYVYNALKTLRWEGVHDHIWRDDQVKNVHYILTPNPWDDLDENGDSTSKDETHAWWAEANKERKTAERAKGVDDEFS